MQLHDFLFTIITILKEHGSLFQQLIEQQTHTNQSLQHPPPEKDEILDMNDLRKMLNMSFSTYKRRVLDGTLVPKELGGKDYFLRSEIEDLIEKKKNRKPKQPHKQ